jgi:hypothetical protein
MTGTDRREFMQEVGEGMLAVIVGPALLAELGLGANAYTDDTTKPVPGGLGKLAGLLQQTAPAKLLPALAEQVKKGVGLRDLIAAGAIANVRAFGGQDYVGFHTFMALCPSYSMAMALPEKERAVPIFKVLFRNSNQIHGKKCHEIDSLAEAKPAKLKDGVPAREQLRDAAREKNVAKAEQVFAAMKDSKPEQDYADIQLLVQDDLNVHRVVLAWRSWEVLGFTGKDQARSMLRQTVRFCADASHQRRDPSPIRTALPKLLEGHKLLSSKVGTRKADDAAVEKLAKTVYQDTPLKAAEAVAAALADGVAPDSISEAISLAATMLVLGDPGRPKEWTSDGKPEGSVHGDSVGVHASDAANAWRHIAAVSSARNTFASLIASAYHTAGQAGRQMKVPYPLDAEIEKVTEKDAAKVLAALDEAIKGKDQKRASAVAARYGALGHDAKALVALCRKYAVSEDGALHAEKYYQTTTEEFARGRAAFRWRHLVALARVTASLYGRPAPGMADTRKLLGV